MKKFYVSKGKGLVGAVLLGLVALTSGCSSGTPPEDFLKSPLSIVYINGAENNFEGKLSVEDLSAYGINPQAKKSWRHVEEGIWSLIASQKDNVTGNTTEVNLVLAKMTSPDRVILQRILVNGTEANAIERDQLSNTFGYGRWKQRIKPANNIE